MAINVGDINVDLDESSLRGYLNEHKYPAGIIEVVSKGLKKVPIRFFVIDDSGSMSETDGNLLVKSGMCNIQPLTLITYGFSNIWPLNSSGFFSVYITAIYTCSNNDFPSYLV